MRKNLESQYMICVVGNDPDPAKIAGDLWLYRRDILDHWDAESVE
jgi:hypothetical protein